MKSKAFDAGFPIEIIREGRVKVAVPKLEAYVREPSDYAPSKAPVFYNPVMEFNRDISVLALQAYQRTVNKEISLCEPLTSSGVRGARYAAEIQGVNKVLINDISLRAIRLAKYNVESNDLQHRISVTHKDANCILSCHGKPRQRFHVVDLDPFGTPAPYLDSAIRALRNDGLLAMTATDLAPLCGVHPKACVRKYGGKPLRTEYCHELAVRLLLGSTTTFAGKHDIGIHVMFSHSTDHYIRTYVQVGYGARKADENLKKAGYVLHCFKCLHRETTTSLYGKNTCHCPECGAVMDYAGPLWLGRLWDRNFCQAMITENLRRPFKNSTRIESLLSTTLGEAEASPTYYVLDRLSAKMRLPAPAVDLTIRALKEKGFQAIPTHFNSKGIRTDAPSLAMQNILRALKPSDCDVVANRLKTSLPGKLF